MSSDRPAVSFRSVFKQYHRKEYYFAQSDLFWALSDVTFAIGRGEAVSILGSNGAGKTTIAKLISGITQPTTGIIQVTGRVIPLISMGGCLDAFLDARENIELFLSIFRVVKQKEKKRIASEIADFSGLSAFMDMPIKHYSAGMWSRLAFSIAAHVPGDILLIDEVLAVEDYEFQQKCLAKIADFKRAGRTIVFISHDLEQVRKVSDRILWLERGKVVLDGGPDRVLSAYLDKTAGS